MSSPFIGEIRIFAGNFAPAGWMTCDGQLLPISEFDSLFNLIGTTYGGDGQNTFALPSLTARVPLHQGNNGTTTYNLADNGGVPSVTLALNQIPAHTHTVVADDNVANTTSGVPLNAFYGNTAPNSIYASSPVPRNLKTMMTLPLQGGSQPHDNLQPFLTLTYIISLFGIFPSQF